jgi:SnoaL-like protein
MPRRPRLPPLLAEFDDEEREAVLAANRAFYRAFAERDVAGMDQIWAQTGAVVCLHPGQAPLHGRAEIMASWRGILRHPESPKVRCVGEWVIARGWPSSSAARSCPKASSWRPIPSPARATAGG